MKKILFVLLLVSLFLPLLTWAQAGPVECCKIRRAVTVDDVSYAKDAIVGPSTSVDCPLGTVATANATEKWGVVCMVNTMNAAVDWIFVILIVLSVVLTMMGAYNLMMSAGDTAKVEAGRNFIMYAAGGLLAAFIARAIPSLVKAVMGY